MQAELKNCPFCGTEYLFEAKSQKVAPQCDCTKDSKISIDNRNKEDNDKNPNNKDIKKEIELLLAQANVAQREGQTEEAKQLYSEVLLLDKKNIKALSERGRYYLDSYNPEALKKALATFEKAIALDEDNEELKRDFAGSVFNIQGRLSVAILEWILKYDNSIKRKVQIINYKLATSVADAIRGYILNAGLDRNEILDKVNNPKNDYERELRLYRDLIEDVRPQLANMKSLTLEQMIKKGHKEKTLAHMMNYVLPVITVGALVIIFILIDKFL